MAETRTRLLTESERRLLEARARNLRRGNRRRPWALTVAAVVIFGALWAWTLAASGAPWHAVTVFWLVVGAGITLWIRRDLQKDLATFDAMLNGIESALRTDMASVLDVQARAFVAFEEVEDEGATYAFEIAGNTLLFLLGQQYYEAAKFPSLDFSLVNILDEHEGIVDELIEKRGPKATPERIIPAATKLNLELPDDQEMIQGTLDELEELLRARGGELLQPLGVSLDFLVQIKPPWGERAEHVTHRHIGIRRVPVAVEPDTGRR